MADMADLRERINEVDRKIVELMVDRLEIARQIGAYKMENGIPIRDVEREELVFKKYRDNAEAMGISPDVAEAVCRILVKDSVDEQAANTPNTSGSKTVGIIGGKGRMGRWLDLLLTGDGHKTIIVDVGTETTLEDCKDADIVIISTPIPTIKELYAQLDKICSKDTVLTDLASIKSSFYRDLIEMSQHRKVCSMHPMFASSDRSLYDRNLIMCDCGNKEALDIVRTLFANKGANIITMEVEKHDKYMSYVLGMSHAINIAFFDSLVKSGFTYSELNSIASTTFRKSLDANKSVAFDNPVLYHDIQYLNENSKDTWDIFYSCITELKEASLKEDKTDFVDIMSKGREYFSE